MMAELCGRATGYCSGRGGSMHIADVEKGNLGATGIVGGNIPVATGAALVASRCAKTDRVVLCFFGDGASNTGNFHESLNMASTWSLPVVYIVENNLYGMSVPFRNASANARTSPTRAAPTASPAWSWTAWTCSPCARPSPRPSSAPARGEGPTLIECKTYRWYGHSRSDPRAYRTQERKEQTWHDRDPIAALSDCMLVEPGSPREAEVRRGRGRSREGDRDGRRVRPGLAAARRRPSWSRTSMCSLTLRPPRSRRSGSCASACATATTHARD